METQTAFETKSNFRTETSNMLINSAKAQHLSALQVPADWALGETCVTACLWSSVGDALQDPVDGGWVKRQVLGRLHPLQGQLVLDAFATDLPEGAEQVEEVAV